MAHLRFGSVRKAFGPLVAIHQLDLEIERGEAIVLLGPSGCGKTTTLRLLAGFERPDAGRIEIDDREVASQVTLVPPHKRNMSVVFQSYALWPHMTVRDNIAFGPKLQRRRDRAWVAERVERSLSLVKLDGLDARYPHELSGGQQQRVALARALAVEPEILLLDEPLSNLDTRLREEMRFEVKRLQRDLGVTMVYVTHDPAEALSLADRIVVMNKGEIEQVGSPTNVYLQPRTEFVATSLGPTNLLPSVIASDGTLQVLGAPAGRVRTGTATEEASATVSIRPSRIELGEQTSEAHLAGTVQETLFFGDVVQYAIKVPGFEETVKVTVSGISNFGVGDQVSLHWSPSDAALLTESESSIDVEPAGI